MNREQTHQLQGALQNMRAGLTSKNLAICEVLSAFKAVLHMAAQPTNDVVEPKGLTPTQIDGFLTLVTALTNVREEILTSQAAWEVEVNERLSRLESKFHSLAADAA